MISINLKSLVDKMSPTMRDALEGAAGLCLAHNQYNVEIEHWLLKLLDQTDTGLFTLLEKHEVDPARLAKQLAGTIAKFKAGSTRPAALSPSIVEAAKNAWMLASVDYGHAQLSSGHLLAALLLDEQLRRQVLESCPELKNIAPESIRETARTISISTGETTSGAMLATEDAPDAAAASSTPSLDKYTVNLTERAKNGEIDPVLGRDEEIRQCIDILTRRRQNNPILTGEAGVGKTAVVEGFALRIANNDVPDPLKGVMVRTLDLGLLQAGAAVKGEFENRLKSVIEEVKASPIPIIMFIDEAHTMIGAGGKEGQGDAANLLKPALARGELRTIAATTWAEYKKYFERDPALTRRFQVVKVEEPSEEKGIEMMRGISKSLIEHHKVRILDEAIVASVQLSHRYIPGRQLPDKSVSLLDTACARVALSQTATPGAIEDLRRRIQESDATITMIERENAATGAHEERLSTMKEQKDAMQNDLDEYEQQWEKETALINDIQGILDQIDANFLRSNQPDLADAANDANESSAQTEADTDDAAENSSAENNTPSTEGAPLTAEELEELKINLQTLTTELKDIQGEIPLMQASVDAQAIAEVVSNWTGIPVGKMVSDEITSIQNLAGSLGQRVIGQPHALEAVAQAVKTSRAGLTDPRKPIGVFLFVGTSGVGKTETALALADQLYGGEQNITTINMSEFKEEHKVSMLLGSPPGYVGYGEGGVLTEAARRKPYSVILLDEMEKAHPGVQDIFYSLFDKGTIKDGEGRDIDFKNTVIIMTSNAGEDAIRAIFSQVEEKPEPDVLLDSIRPELLKKFKPAFLGRTNLISFYPLDDEDLMKISALNMNRIEKRVKSHYGASFSYDEEVLLHIVARCQESDTGARNIENILTRTLLPELASECLSRMANEEDINSIHIGVSEEGAFTYQLG